MPWSMETKAGLGWAFLIAIVFVGSAWAMNVMRSTWILIVPVLVYVAFLAWVRRAK